MRPIALVLILRPPFSTVCGLIEDLVAKLASLGCSTIGEKGDLARSSLNDALFDESATEAERGLDIVPLLDWPTLPMALPAVNGRTGGEEVSSIPAGYSITSNVKRGIVCL